MPRDRQGQAMEPTNSARSGSDCRACSAQEPGWLVERLRLGVGHARNRPARSLHPGRGGRTRLPPRGPLAGLSQATPVSPTPPYSMPPLLEGWARPTAIGSIADRDPVAPNQGYQRDVTDREL